MGNNLCPSVYNLYSTSDKATEQRHINLLFSCSIGKPLKVSISETSLYFIIVFKINLKSTSVLFFLFSS